MDRCNILEIIFRFFSTPTLKKTRMSVGATPKTTGKADATSKTKTTTKKAAKAATPAGPGTAKKRKIVELESDVSDVALQ